MAITAASDESEGSQPKTTPPGQWNSEGLKLRPPHDLIHFRAIEPLAAGHLLAAVTHIT